MLFGYAEYLFVSTGTAILLAVAVASELCEAIYE
jgi:hypothetical protein